MNKNKKVAMLSVVLIGAFVLSSFGNVALIAPTSGQTVTNFELIVETNTGNRRRESFALYLKQALAPLGIDVTIIGKPFSQFVGDLLHFTGATWDISIVGFVGGSPFAPSFVDLYACDGGFFGVLTYQVCEDSWNEALIQSSTAQGNPLNQSMVDDLLWDMEQEFNIPARKQMTDTFQQWFMEQLLYDYPLLAPTGLVGIWAGFEGYDANEGIIGSAFTGGYWDYANYGDTLSERDNDNETVAFTIGTIDPVFDPLQGASSSQSTAESYLFPQLTTFDKNYAQHPWIATTYNRSDWLNAPVLNESDCAGDNIATCTDTGNTTTIPYGHIQYTIRNDVQWINTTGGPTPTGNYVTAEDFAFTFELYRSSNIVINGQSSFINMYDVQYDNAAGTIDLYIYKPTLDDLFFGGYNAVPAWLLKGLLTLDNGSTFDPLDPTAGDLNSTALFEEGITAFDSVEWDAFEKNPVQAGPYYVDFSDDQMFKNGEYLKKAANPYFWFPNEKDSPGQDFDLTVAGPEDTYFFDYNGTDDTNELTIKNIVMPIVDDLTVDLLLFKTGAIDLNSPDFFGGAEIQNQKNDPRFEVHSFATTATADLLMFNLLNPDLSNYDVRRAIAHSVNKEELGAIVDNLREPQDSPVKLLFLDWYKDDWKIPFDPDAAAQLMVENGYKIPTAEDILTSTTEVVNPVTSLVQVGDDLLLFFAAFATVFTAFAIKKKRKF